MGRLFVPLVSSPASPAARCLASRGASSHTDLRHPRISIFTAARGSVARFGASLCTDSGRRREGSRAGTWTGRLSDPPCRPGGPCRSVRFSLNRRSCLPAAVCAAYVRAQDQKGAVWLSEAIWRQRRDRGIHQISIRTWVPRLRKSSNVTVEEQTHVNTEGKEVIAGWETWRL